MLMKTSSSAASSLSPFAVPVIRPPAAILGGESARRLMADFARTLHQRGFSVVGVVQQTLRGEDGRKSDMVLVDVISGDRLSVSQKLGSGSQSCTLDEQAVCSVSGRLLSALEQHPDLLVLSKFAHLEAEGRGFRAEFATAASGRIPVLTTVPLDSVGAWMDFTGGRGVLLPPDPEALWQWWGAAHLLADLAGSLSGEAGTVRQTVLGRHWVMLEGACGWGLAPVPAYAAMTADPPPPPAVGMAMQDVAVGLMCGSPWGAAWALAALVAGHGKGGIPLDGPYQGVSDACDPIQPMTVVSVLSPSVQASLVALPAGAMVLSLPQAMVSAPWWLPSASVVLLPAATLAERSLPALLGHVSPETSVVLSGVSVPLTPRLLSYGVSALVGAEIHDPGGCAQAIRAGASDERDLLPFVRLRVLAS